MKENQEIAIKIIDLFESLLNRKNIIIPNEDRRNSKDEAAIYGGDYYELEDKIVEILEQKVNNNNEIVKIGFDNSKCFKMKNIIIGRGLVYYYNSEEEYNRNEEKNTSLFLFKYDIQKERIIKVRCNDKESKYLVENDTDDFIDNIKNNLIPEVEKV